MALEVRCVGESLVAVLAFVCPLARMSSHVTAENLWRFKASAAGFTYEFPDVAMNQLVHHQGGVHRKSLFADVAFVRLDASVAHFMCLQR